MGLNGSRQQVANILERADYQKAVTQLRDSLRRHLITILGGGDWEKIHNEFGMYTIVCRVKSAQRTLEKFDKLVERGEMPSAENFYKCMPDLVGARLVVVDPGDLIKLAEQVKNGCQPPVFESAEPAFRTALVRHGKFSMYDTDAFSKAGYKIEEESTGYCSIHFIYRLGQSFFETLCRDDELKDLKKLDTAGIVPMDGWLVEIQVRTMMDEAWGEIDHFVRYEDPLLREDPEITEHFTALSAYLQAANHHVFLIRQTARRKKERKQ
jgi:ppGpp synthetase/RelA/SpoT-type nucleotidyltranferase